MGLAAGCNDVVSSRCTTETARKAWTVVSGCGPQTGPPGRQGDDSCSVTSQQVLPASSPNKRSDDAPLEPVAARASEQQALASQSKRRNSNASNDSKCSRASSRGSFAESADSPRSSAASSTFTEDFTGDATFSSDDEGGTGVVISQGGLEFVWHGEPLAPLRDLLESGKLRRKHHAALEAELDSLNEEALATLLAVAHGRQRLLPRGKPLRLLPPRELHWTVKKKPKLKHGASVTDLATTPRQIRDDWRRSGLKMLGSSKVGVVLLLPSRGPDGLDLEESLGPASEDIGLLSGKSSVRLIAERIRRLQHLAERQQGEKGGRHGGCKVICRVPLYIMADAANRLEVEAYFQHERHFGLEPSNIHVFAQPLDPVFDRTGHTLLAEPWHVGRASGGSGALFEALQRSGMREDMLKRRLSHAFVMPCDNLLARVADPVFLGYAASLGAPCCLKVAVRTEVTDPLGIFCTHHEHHDVLHPPEARVVEGFELHEVHRHQKDRDGHLRLRVVSLSQFVFPTSLFFGEDGGVPRVLPHAVPTSWPRFDPESMTVTEPKPGELNAIKLECFLSDVFSSLPKPDVPALLVERRGEYAAAPTMQELRREDAGVHKACVAMSLLHQNWVMAAGGTFRDGILGGSHGKDLCEVSPLVSYEGEGLEGYFHGDIDLPLHLSAHGERKAGSGTRMLSLVKRPGASVCRQNLNAGGDDGFAEKASEGEELPPTPPSEPEEVAPVPPPRKREIEAEEAKKAFSPRRSSPRFNRFSDRYNEATAPGHETLAKVESVPAPGASRENRMSAIKNSKEIPEQEARQRNSNGVDQLSSFLPPHGSPGQARGSARKNSASRTPASVRTSSSPQGAAPAQALSPTSAPQPGAGVWTWIEEELPKSPKALESGVASAPASVLRREDAAGGSVRQHRHSKRKGNRSSRSRGSSASGEEEAEGRSSRSSGRGRAANGARK